MRRARGKIEELLANARRGSGSLTKRRLARSFKRRTLRLEVVKKLVEPASLDMLGMAVDERVPVVAVDKPAHLRSSAEPLAPFDDVALDACMVTRDRDQLKRGD